MLSKCCGAKSVEGHDNYCSCCGWKSEFIGYCELCDESKGARRSDNIHVCESCNNKYPVLSD